MAKILLLLTLICLSAAIRAADDEQTPAPSEPASTPATPPVPAPSPRLEIVPPKSREYFLNQDTQRYFQADELKQLLAGEDDFYALFRPDMTGTPRGVALLIPDWGIGANSRGIDMLRTSLPDYGWVTLAMTVPQQNEPVYSLAKTSQNLASQPAPADPLKFRPAPSRSIDENFIEQYELRFKLRLLALINEAQNHQGYFIIIAQGSSAALVASLYNKEELELPEALILLSAALPDAKLNQKMNQDITGTSIATLEIYPATAPRTMIDNIQRRRKLARKNFKVHYRQQKLFSDISYYNQNHKMLRSIYGWLHSLGL